MIEPLNKAQYTLRLADLTDPDLSQAWSIIEECYHAQEKMLTAVNFNTPERPPQIVPLKVVTYLTQKYQWSIDVDILPNQMRRINRITLI